MGSAEVDGIETGLSGSDVVGRPVYIECDPFEETAGSPDEGLLGAEVESVAVVGMADAVDD